MSQNFFLTSLCGTLKKTTSTQGLQQGCSKTTVIVHGNPTVNTVGYLKKNDHADRAARIFEHSLLAIQKREITTFRLRSIDPIQEPMTRSEQKPFIPVTAFSLTNLFLD